MNLLPNFDKCYVYALNILSVHPSLCRPIMGKHMPFSLAAVSYFTCVLILINYMFDLFFKQ